MASELNGTAWMKWAIGAMGATIMLLAGLWVNGMDGKITGAQRDHDKLESDFGIVRNEQLLRTGRLEGLKSDISALESKIADISARLGKLENASARK